MHFLITGHTGFKGSWLTLCLTQSGHQVSGIALDPEPDGLYELARIAEFLDHDMRADIRNAKNVHMAFEQAQPDVVIHMAAQPLVRDSYRDPRWTFETNVMGTLNILEAAGVTSTLRAQLIVTTDKVYRNVKKVAGYVESDPLGGDDPYSASKAMADVMAQSWLRSFNSPRTAIARAGNVIGGGDVSKDRLFPDIVQSLSLGRAPNLRYPQAVRPWQHVLDCLHGYVTLIDRLIAPDSNITSGSAWNFGPDDASFVSVGEVTQRAAQRWGFSQTWSCTEAEFHEAEFLALNSAKAQHELGWKNLLPLDEAVNWTMDWFREVKNGSDPRDETLRQISLFRELTERM